MPELLKYICTVSLIITLNAVAEPNDPNGPEVIKLPEVNTANPKTLMHALKNRKSSRQFSREPLEHQTIGDMLWAGFGINRPDSGKRTAPSTMDWREIDIYACTENGLFLYDPGKHALKKILAEDIRSLTGKQAFVAEAPLNLIFVADYSKMTGDEKSKDFYAAADTAFISQNIYLYCAAKNLATVVRGWVDREKLADAMKLNQNQNVILAQTVGHHPKPKERNPTENKTEKSEPAEKKAPADKPQNQTKDPNSSPYRDGTYRGSGTGYEGQVTVEVKIADGKIAAVNVISERESRPGQSLKQIPQQILKKGSPENIDAVTGATVTSNAIFRAVKMALEKARKTGEY
jgi:uncharacterized protein with FMN-binding domain/nitroreductase